MLTLIAAISVVLVAGATLHIGINRLLRRLGITSTDKTASNAQLIGARLQAWRAGRSDAKGRRIE